MYRDSRENMLEVLAVVMACGSKGLWPHSCRAPAVWNSEPEVGNSRGGFLHCILFLSVPRGIVILVSRPLLSSGSCPISPRKTRFFAKLGDQRIHSSIQSTKHTHTHTHTHTHSLYFLIFLSLSLSHSHTHT